VSAIYILWLRELKRYSRSRAQIFASLGSPMLYLIAFGFGLGPVFKGFRPAHVSTLPLVALFMVLISVVFAALGTAIGSQLQNMQGFQLIMNFLVMPIFFLSGALFPLTGLPTAMAFATRIDPLTYGIDGLRGAFIQTAHFSMATDIAVLFGTACLFLVLGARAFAKIQM
jgi:ABC-2 type transport system permease protein